MVHDVEVWKNVNLGSDHRAIRMTIGLPGRGKSKQTKGPRKQRGGKGWKPTSSKEYESNLANGLKELGPAMDKAKEEGVDELLRKIEAVVTDTAATCEKVQDLEVKQENAEVKEEVEEEEDLQRLVEERRRLRHEGCKGKSISDLSKQIQRQIKRLQRRKQDKKIRTILDSFSGLKDIAGIRGGGKRKQTNAMRKKDGTEVQGKKRRRF